MIEGKENEVVADRTGAALRAKAFADIARRSRAGHWSAMCEQVESILSSSSLAWSRESRKLVSSKVYKFRELEAPKASEEMEARTSQQWVLLSIIYEVDRIESSSMPRAEKLERVRRVCSEA